MHLARMRALLAGGLLALAACAHGNAAAQDGAPAQGQPDSRELLYARLLPEAKQPVQQRITSRGAARAEDLRTPLGSVWKLFTYAYVVDRAIPAPEYFCGRSPEAAKEEVYCCDPGQSIGRDKALAQSCGLFFEPGRLHLDARDWAAYWRVHAPEVTWLADLANMKPAFEVSVASLLQALAGIRGEPRLHAESALLAVVLNGRGQSALRYLGGRYRVKTYTWVHTQRPGVVFGGGAGWLSDGSAVWFGAVGSSLQVLKDHGPELAAAAEAGAPRVSASGRCVDVALFARYPIRQVSALEGAAEPAPGGDLRGRYRVEFENGRQLLLVADQEIRLGRDGKNRPALSARLDENEYVARVLDREGRAADTEAAKALSVVARTYLLQNAAQHGECLAIADSSRTQRVSPNAASAAARGIAAFTDGLVLQGASVQYRLDGEGPDVLSWKNAVAQSRHGMLFDEILQQAFAHGSLASVNGEVECKPLPDAQRWLKAQARQWRRALEAEPGFTEPRPQVCLLGFGNPYSDLSRQRIYVRGLASLNHRLTLAHEYLHLAFSGYPSGQDENYIEHWARRLIEGDARS